VPDDLAAQLPLDRFPRLRIEGELSELPFNAAMIPSQQGRHMIVSPELLKAAGLRVGDIVEIRFNIADQEGVAVPEELQTELDNDPQAEAVWSALTPGRRRGLAHLVAKPKGEAIRRRKAQELAEALGTGTPLPGMVRHTAKPVGAD
jgi:hypothetical protein